MARIISVFVGLVLVWVFLWSLGHGAAAYITDPPKPTVESRFHLEPKRVHFASDGPFGKFDRQQLQRGFKVFSEVCVSCHRLTLVTFRDLKGLGYNDAEVKAIAKQWKIDVPDINPETGEAAGRKAIPADHFPSPYANETAGRLANNNALPPDLSDITKSREGGADYVHSLLTGYRDAATYKNEKGEALPAENRPSATTHFNPYFANLNIAMPPPLTADGQVEYTDGTKPTVDQMAKDVAAFLVWTAEPKLEDRHADGEAVLVFLIFATILAYFAYKNVWAEQKLRAVSRVGALDPENIAKRQAASRDAGITE